MLFLRENFEPRTTSGNLNSSETVSETEENFENISDSEEADNPSTPISETSESISNTQPPSRSVTQSSSTAPDSLGYRKRARPTDVIGSQIVELEKEKLRMRKEKELQSSNKHDEDVAFFTSLLPHVRRMDPINKMTFRIEVQKLVMERAYGVGYGSIMSKDTNKYNPPAEGRENLLRHTSAPPSIFETYRDSPHVSSMIPAYSRVYSTSIFPQPHFTELGVPTSLRSHNSPDESVNSFQANEMGGGQVYNEPQGMQGTFMMDKNKN